MDVALRRLLTATNWPLLMAVSVLTFMGAVSIWYDSNITGEAEGIKQLIFIGLGAGILMLTQVFHYQQIGRIAWGMYVLSIIMLLYTVMPGVPEGGLFSVPRINGARAWIDFKVLKFQPAEMTKVAFILVLARYLRFRSNYRTFGGLIPPFLLAFGPLLLILKQPDLGTAMVFVPALVAMLFVAGARTSHLLSIGFAVMMMIPVAWLSGQKGVPLFEHMPSVVKGYQRERVKAMFSDDPMTLQRTGFQQHNALIAFGSGGLAGKGVGQIVIGRRVPESHNDMIFALIGEQFGFWGVLLVLGAYGVIFVTGIEIAGSTRDPYGRLVALGVVALIAGQAFLNMLVAMKMFPVTGVTLPLVSYGGTSLLASFFLIGILMNIGQHRPLVMARESFEFAH